MKGGKTMLEQYKDIMTVNDLTKIFHVGKNRVYKLLEDGDIKAFRIGSVWKISKQAVEDYITTKSESKK